MDVFHGKPIDLNRLKANILKDLGRHRDFWRQRAEKLLEFTLPVKDCPVCGAGSASEAAVIHGFAWLQCDSCSHVYNSRRMNTEQRLRFYRATTDPINYADFYMDPEANRYRLEHVAQPKVIFIEKYVKSRPLNWLDVGCGNGDIPYVVNRRGHKAVGLEPNPACIAYAKKYYDLEIVPSTVEDYQSAPGPVFDVVSMLGLTDLIPDPCTSVSKAAGLLKDTGKLAVSFPNFNSFSTAVQRAFPDQIMLRHLYPTVMNMYTFSSAEKVIHKAGLTIESVWWWGMDVFELANNVTLMEPRSRDSGLIKMLFQYMNELQSVFDRAEQSDEFMIIAKKIH